MGECNETTDGWVKAAIMGGRSISHVFAAGDGRWTEAFREILGASNGVMVYCGDSIYPFEGVNDEVRGSLIDAISGLLDRVYGGMCFVVNGECVGRISGLLHDEHLEGNGAVVYRLPEGFSTRYKGFMLSDKSIVSARLLNGNAVYVNDDETIRGFREEMRRMIGVSVQMS
ncbi:MAG: hypothetical protein J6Y37_12065 [Paludibacteraceae bacterium]|nr:hypothetical protein [Paludibacteraceae bacterium]